MNNIIDIKYLYQLLYTFDIILRILVKNSFLYFVSTFQYIENLIFNV